jgi:hypothetical protein
MSFFKTFYDKIETFFEILADARLKSIQARKNMWY